MSTVPVPHDYQDHNRKGKFVPVTTWHWVDADEDLQHGQPPPTASVDYVQPATTPVAPQNPHTAPNPRSYTASNLLDVDQFGGNATLSTSASYHSAVAQADAQSLYAQTDMIQFPNYSQSFYNPVNTYQAYHPVLPYRSSPTDTAEQLPAWSSSLSGISSTSIARFDRSELPPSIDTAWVLGIDPIGLDPNLSAQSIAPFRDSPTLYPDIVDTLLADIHDAGEASNGPNDERFNESISPRSQSTIATQHVSPQTTGTTPDLETPSSNKKQQVVGGGETSRKRKKLPGADKSKEIIQYEGGKFQGMQMVWQGQKAPDRKLDDVQKADRKRRMLVGTCSRCKRLKQPCIGFKESPYLPCESCRKSNPTTITTTCVLEASLLNVTLFRMGPPVDNPFFPLTFFTHRQDILYGLTDGNDVSDTLELELMQDDVGHVLNLTVSRFAPLLGDKTAYEGTGEDGPYKLDMPPYCISDIKKAQQSLIVYMRKAKSAYFNRFVNRSNVLLFNTFKMAAMCDFTKRPLVNKALDIWAATRLIERTWKLCGSETLGIHPSENRSDPWKGFVPVTPIMDQQLDQVVIREVLVPRRNQFLNQLKEKVYTEDNRKLHAFEVYLTFFILINNTEMQIAAEREFAQRYGFSGRFGPRGKYMDAEAQFHAARTMLGHFHYICRANSLWTTSSKSLGELGVSDKERKYLEYVRRQVEIQKPHFTTLVQEHRYETPMYLCHQMLFNEWNPGLGHIEELPEMMVGEVMTAA